MIASLIPVLIRWWSLPDAFVLAPPDVPDVLRWGLVMMAVGVFVSGVRDLYAAHELPHTPITRHTLFFAALIPVGVPSIPAAAQSDAIVQGQVIAATD